MRHRLLSSLAVAGFLAFSGVSKAQEALQITRLDPAAYPATIVEDDRQAAPKGLPDGKVELARGGDLSGAWYALPTDRYAHAVLGDGIEAGAVRAKIRGGPITQFKLPQNRVFEDITPRLVDLDRDGRMELVTILASLTEGASVTIFGLNGLKLEVKASTGFIGTANRWLNIAGFSNFTGGSKPQIAFVTTPHIGGKLVFLAYDKGKLSKLGEAQGFSNHVIGSRELRLSAIADINEDRRGDLALPSQDRRTLRVMGFPSGSLVEIANARLPSPINKAIGVEGSGRETRFIVGLEDGSVYAVHR